MSAEWKERLIWGPIDALAFLAILTTAVFGLVFLRDGGHPVWVSLAAPAPLLIVTGWLGLTLLRPERQSG